MLSLIFGTARALGAPICIQELTRFLLVLTRRLLSKVLDYVRRLKNSMKNSFLKFLIFSDTAAPQKL